jgi:hypothetical protein
VPGLKPRLRILPLASYLPNPIPSQAKLTTPRRHGTDQCGLRCPMAALRLCWCVPASRAISVSTQPCGGKTTHARPETLMLCPHRRARYCGVSPFGPMCPRWCVSPLVCVPTGGLTRRLPPVGGPDDWPRHVERSVKCRCGKASARTSRIVRTSDTGHSVLSPVVWCVPAGEPDTATTASGWPRRLATARRAIGQVPLRKSIGSHFEDSLHG